MSHYFVRTGEAAQPPASGDDVYTLFGDRETPAEYADVDVAIVCESTYPYLTGGLSAVVHQICVAHPGVKIGIIHITWDSSSPKVDLYGMPENVEWVMPVYQSMREHPELTASRPADSGLSKRAQHAAVDRLFGALDAHMAGDDGPLWSLYDDGINPLTRSFRLWPLMTTQRFMTRALDRFAASGMSVTDLFWKVRELASLAFAATDARFPRATIYHAHTTGAAALLSAAAARQNDGRFLLTEHNLYTRDTINHALSRSMATVVRENDWKTEFTYPDVNTGQVLSPTRDMRAWMLWWTQLGKIAYRSADLITYLYPEAIGEAAGLGGDATKSIVVPNGVTPEHFDTARAQLADRQAAAAEDRVWQFAYAARVVPIKGLLDLIDALALVVEAGFTQWHLDVMGPAGEAPAYVARCHEAVAAAGMTDKITFLGSVNLRERLGLYDALLLPSHNEGQPIVVLEAMTIGLPTIGTRVGGMQELVEDELRGSVSGESIGPCGLLVEPHEVDAMAAALLRFIESPGLAAELGANGERRVMECFHIDQAMAHYGGLYAGGIPAALDRIARQRLEIDAAVAAVAQESAPVLPTVDSVALETVATLVIPIVNGRRLRRDAGLRSRVRTPVEPV